MDDQLFSSRDLAGFLSTKVSAARRAVAEADPTILRENPLQVVEEVRSQQVLEPLAVDFAKKRRSQPLELTTTVVQFGRRMVQDAYGFRIYVPFTGDSELFQMRPGTFLSSGAPHGEVRTNPKEVSFEVKSTESNAAALQQVLMQIEGQISQYVSFVNDDLAVWQRTLASAITEAVNIRRDRLEKADKLANDLDIPIHDEPENRW